MPSINSDLTPVPAGSANGTPLPEPDMTASVLFYLPAGSSITFTIASQQPTSPPANTITYAGDDIRRAEEPLGSDQHIYVTAKTGTPLYRFI